jgi:hypothetical protein
VCNNFTTVARQQVHLPYFPPPVLRVPNSIGFLKRFALEYISFVTALEKMSTWKRAHRNGAIDLFFTIQHNIQSFRHAMESYWRNTDQVLGYLLQIFVDFFPLKKRAEGHTEFGLY